MTQIEWFLPRPDVFLPPSFTLTMEGWGKRFWFSLIISEWHANVCGGGAESIRTEEGCWRWNAELFLKLLQCSKTKVVCLFVCLCEWISAQTFVTCSCSVLFSISSAPHVSVSFYGDASPSSLWSSQTSELFLFAFIKPRFYVSQHFLLKCAYASNLLINVFCVYYIVESGCGPRWGWPPTPLCPLQPWFIDLIYFSFVSFSLV